MIAASLSMTVPGPVLANEFEPETNGQREVTGMIVFRIPFGGPRRHKRAPEVGFNLTIADPKLRDYKQRRFEPESGRWLPSLDTERIQTWPLDSHELRSDAPEGTESHR